MRSGHWNNLSEVHCTIKHDQLQESYSSYSQALYGYVHQGGGSWEHLRILPTEITRGQRTLAGGGLRTKGEEARLGEHEMEAPPQLDGASWGTIWRYQLEA